MGLKGGKKSEETKIKMKQAAQERARKAKESKIALDNKPIIC